ncbi:alpha/beta hydrolase [Mycolicibacterium austroafricanum]|uniref:Alpha/beta hydrolase n=1 Tax=Mycolicibacterium austroafricanum TaxID=39687 RepID=A0ABT8H6L0_MYCAO|nr:alpha/beta hydrolase [Mycolicibacterium austroafricanum]MDN4516404.1 alpha/beta hydrolase [Mycolicibacterium austroafricanum]QRZ07061.1 alpha/beta hydrolase [Mycolicibacterium austroafricanum]QZT68546.1 alpha/beta hydrolase family protein [Mycolicibacterium austroafricanum]QZY46261.1 alpha/beta hydrolase family protein [Mycolicibacterium austroafricanum]
MAVSVSTVRDSKPDRLVDAADATGRHRSELQTIIAGQRESLSHLQEHWSGQAASAALARGLDDIARQDRVAGRLLNLESALRNGGLQMGALRDALLDLVSSLERFGFAVADDGTVTPEQWLVGQFLDSLADKFTGFLQKMLQLFTDLDENTAAAIDQAAGVDIPNPPVEVGGQDIHIPSPDTDPADVKQWWDSLSEQQRRELIDRHPPMLGNLNGIPAEVRDQVNVAVMDDDLDRVQNVADRNGVSTDEVAGNPGRYGLTDGDVTRYQNAKRTQEGLLHQLGAQDGETRRYSEIGEQERRDKNWRPTMLWAYDPQAFDGKGRAAVSIGNPDRASNTAVIVPGTSASVRDGWLSDGHNDAIHLYGQSLKAAPADPTAVISWMGYNTPESFTDPNIANTGLARAGGDALAWDVNGLNVTHEAGVPEHVTVIGHSYGSTTVADAFANSGMQADDAILLGSPGTDVARSAADFNLDGGQVYIGDASTDPVGWLGQMGNTLPGELNDSLGNMVGPTAGLGADPAFEDFGATRFRAEVPGADMIDPSDHSYYYTVGSESLRSMTEIVTGNGGRLDELGLLAQPRTELTVSTPQQLDVPVLGEVPLPHLEVETPVIYDPEWNRAGGSVTNDHGY